MSGLRSGAFFSPEDIAIMTGEISIAPHSAQGCRSRQEAFGRRLETVIGVPICLP
jgi:hypothetical protein